MSLTCELDTGNNTGYLFASNFRCFNLRITQTNWEVTNWVNGNTYTKEQVDVHVRYNMTGIAVDSSTHGRLKVVYYNGNAVYDSTHSNMSDVYAIIVASYPAVSWDSTDNVYKETVGQTTDVKYLFYVNQDGTLTCNVL